MGVSGRLGRAVTGQPRRRRRIWSRVAMVAVGALVVAGCDLLLEGPGGATGHAERRVGVVLKNLVSAQGRGGREADEAAAEAAWWDGSAYLNDPVIEARAREEFLSWRSRKGLVYGGLGSAEVVGSTAPAEPGGPVIVSVRIEGQSYPLAVEPDKPIRWAG